MLLSMCRASRQTPSRLVKTAIEAKNDAARVPAAGGFMKSTQRVVRFLL
jgi:redox-regulated HSP33 family molecular chaperone